jgi:hypothetical protein
VSNKEPKERILHTRIPVALEDQIKRLADRLRVPVSNLVRNMLEDAIDMTKRVRDRMDGHVTEVRGGPREASPSGGRSPLKDDVYGWQELTLNIEAPCSRCQRNLSRGERAHVGLTLHPREGRVFICSACLPTQKESLNGSQG